MEACENKNQQVIPYHHNRLNKYAKISRKLFKESQPCVSVYIIHIKA